MARNKVKSEAAYNRRRQRMRARTANPQTWPSIAIPRLRHRAWRDGIEFAITADDIKVPPFCPVLGIPLEPGVKCKPTSPSVDRFDNSKGYVPGNVRVISHRANQLKADASIAELEAVLLYMKS